MSRLERRSEEHTSELQSQSKLVCRLLLEKKKKAFINSRLTMNEQPLVCTPQDAVRSFLVRRLYYLALENFLVPHPRLPEIFFVNDTATTENYTLSLHDALPI